MAENDQRVAWVRDKVCTALGIAEDLFNNAGRSGDEGPDCTLADLEALLDGSRTGGAIFYTLPHFDEVEVEGERWRTKEEEEQKRCKKKLGEE